MIVQETELLDALDFPAEPIICFVCERYGEPTAAAWIVTATPCGHAHPHCDHHARAYERLLAENRRHLFCGNHGGDTVLIAALTKAPL